MSSGDKIQELFYTPYEIMLSEKAMLAMQGEDRFGRVTSGNLEDDMAVLNKMAKRLIPICPRDTNPVSILYAMELGIGEIRLCNPADIIKIYEDVSDHIHAWLYSSEAHWRPEKPVDDLVRMTAFLDSIHEQYCRKKDNLPFSTNLAFISVSDAGATDSFEQLVMRRKQMLRPAAAAGTIDSNEVIETPTKLLDNILNGIL